MTKKIDIPIYRGIEINKDLLVTFSVSYTTDEQYNTITEKQNGSGYVFKNLYSLTISEGYGKSRMYCPSSSWATFVSILVKSIKLIQDNFYNIFPNANKIDWDDIDRKELERFQTEKCMYLNGFSIIPVIYLTSCNEPVPGIRITTKSNESVNIPFEDAILISEILNKIEPNTLAISYLKLLL